MRVQDVMTDQVYKVSPDATAEDAWNVMRLRRIHHLVVTHAGRIVGLLSSHAEPTSLGAAKGAELHRDQRVVTPVAKRFANQQLVVSGAVVIARVQQGDARIESGVNGRDALRLIGRPVHSRHSHERRIGLYQ